MGLDRIINGWKKENNALVLTERFEDFNEALAFIVLDSLPNKAITTLLLQIHIMKFL